jgi:hypothetical protein
MGIESFSPFVGDNLSRQLLDIVVMVRESEEGQKMEDHSCRARVSEASTRCNVDSPNAH